MDNALRPGRGTEGAGLGELRVELHALCQPLMALRCRLEIGQLVGSAEALREAVGESLVQCDRMTSSVRKMQSVVGQMQNGCDAETRGDGVWERW